MTVLPHPVSGLSELAAEPQVLTGVLVGYGRVSTSEQLLDRQLRALTEAGCGRVLTDQLSGARHRPTAAAGPPGLPTARGPLVVASLDRLSRSPQDLITLVADLCRRRVGFRSLREALGTTTPGGRLVFHVFAALAEFIRELIVEGTKEGLDAARARGVRLGRPPAMTRSRSATLIPARAGCVRLTELTRLADLLDAHSYWSDGTGQPVYSSWHRAASMPKECPHNYVPLRERDTDAWRAADLAARERAQAEALVHWRHVRLLADDTASL